MARREIHNELDRKNRNNHNNNYEELYKLKKVINDLVLDSGESDAEVVQARAGEDVLNDRLDNMEDDTDNLGDNLTSLENDINDKLEEKASLGDLDDYTQEVSNELEDKLEEVEEIINDAVGNIEFKGVMLLKSKNQPIESGGTWHTVEWGKASYNLSGFWSDSDNTKIKIPAGVKKVRVSSNVLWTSQDNGRRGMRLRKNGGYIAGGFYSMNFGQGTTPNSATSSVMEVSEGDYFEMEVLQNSGETLDLREDPYTWFSLEVVDYGKK